MVDILDDEIPGVNFAAYTTLPPHTHSQPNAREDEDRPR